MDIMPDLMVIAIDGPAAAGKTTIAQLIAERVGFLFFDTGVMYRAVTYAALREEIAIEDEAKVTAVAEEINIDVQSPTQTDGRAYDVLLNGQDVTWEIRSDAIDQHVSQVSMYRGVRNAMTLKQREIGLRGGVVMVGRDIGTVVLPEADLKIFLEATVEERARRRYKERAGRGEAVVLEDILRSMMARDETDTNRELAPLIAHQDAVTIDTTTMSINEVVEVILQLIN